MKTYVVNMLKDTEKRATIEKQLAKHPELEYQIWEAVEGKKLTPQQQSEMILPEFKQRYGRGGNLPAAGCALSHDSIYRDMIENDVEISLILEDDALLADDMKIEEVSKLLISTEPRVVILTFDFWYKKDGLIKTIDSDYKIYNLSEGYMTSGYLINKQAAKIILSTNYPVGYVADAWNVFKEKGIQLYGIVPHVVSFPKVMGEIGAASRGDDYRKYSIKSILVRQYIRLREFGKFLKGYRKSKVKWR